MQTKTSGLKPKRGSAQPGAGRPLGSKSLTTVRKMAIKTLQEIMQDTSASPEARAISACKLIDIDRVQA
jgi:hypothetical protein